MRQFYFLEPSKVGSQHITLIEGYLTALSSSAMIKDKYELNLCASKETLETLPKALISVFRCKSIPVMNPEKRRLIRKSFVELFIVLRYIVKLRKDDLLFISCVLPTTMWLLELFNYVLRRKGVHVVLHGEIEGAFKKSPQSIKRIGYWAKKWLGIRRPDSLICLVVLDDFIRDKLVHEFPEKFNDTNISVIHHPISPMQPDIESDKNAFSVCFIGYRTRFKGFDDFSLMAKSHSTTTFLAIGGGVVENISTGAIKSLSSKDEYLSEIAKCSMSLFPYSSDYTCSLSAAALDALSVGVHIAALERPFFQSLASYFGSDMVSVHSSIDSLNSYLQQFIVSSKLDDKSSRLGRIDDSKYGLKAVQKSFEKLAI